MSVTVNNPGRRKIIRQAFATGMTVVILPANATKAFLANTPESADNDHLSLILRLADLLRSRLPANMAIELMTLSETTLGTALASRQVALNTALVLRFANEPMPEAIQSFNRLCESDCLAGRTQLLGTWLTCHTELMVAQLHAKLRLSINTRHSSFIDSLA